VNALLDTSVVIDGIPEEVEVASISVITIAELQFGVDRARDAVERQRRLVWMGAMHDVFDPHPVDRAVAQAWGGLAALAAERGKQPRRRAMDLLIAATALVHDVVLLTRDDDLLWLTDVLDVRQPAT
jgi:predicted nucleic acid-binding protein